MREESLLDDMRAAVRGDRQRAERRRAESASIVQRDERPPAAENQPVEPTEPEQKVSGESLFRRLLRRH